MPVVAMPDGTRVQFPDDMPREQIQAMIRKKFPESETTARGDSGELTPERQRELGGKPYQVARGAVQGAIFDPIEGIGQLAEWASGMKIPIPESVRNWFDKVRENTEATTAGKAGRVGGMLASLAVAPESIVGRAGGLTRMSQLAPPVGTAAKMARRKQFAQAIGKRSSWDLTNAERAASDAGHMPVVTPPPTRPVRIARQAAVGAAAGAAQPVEPGAEDFATQKALQAVTGGALGGLAGTRLGDVATKFARHHPWYTGAAVFHPSSSIPTLATLASLYGLKGLERAGPRAAAPIGGAAGRLLSGPKEEAEDAETQSQ